MRDIVFGQMVSRDAARMGDLQQAIAIAASYLDGAEERVTTATEEARPIVALSLIKKARRVLEAAAEI